MIARDAVSAETEDSNRGSAISSVQSAEGRVLFAQSSLCDVTLEEETTMKRKILALSLLGLVLSSIGPGAASTTQSKVTNLVADSGAKLATIRVSARRLLFEGNGADATLFTDQAVFTINNEDKTYRVQSYTDLLAGVSRKAAGMAQSPDKSGTPRGVELTLTGETETIDGLRARKLIKLNNGVADGEFWVSSELLPSNLRAVGEKLRSVLPNDYWRRARGNPGLIEIVTLFGVPLKMTHGHDSWQARVIQGSDSDSSFQVPAGYRKLDN